MPFASKANAVNKQGNIRKGFKEITDKNGKTRYLTENNPVKKTINKDVKKDVKKEKIVKEKTEKAKTKGVAKEKKMKDVIIDSDDDLTVNFD